MNNSNVSSLIPPRTMSARRYWGEAEALEKSRQQTTSLLLQGLQTKDHDQYTLCDWDETIGMIWSKVELNRPVKSGFIFDVQIEEKFRSRGHDK